ncbi:MAG: hypothetical protein BZ151_12040 [Desulfobacca sp. 4484_104]|nr:MAG: hypothetical protein BZ151_12040 [Desulfobacca sp. 4484_104]
MISHSLTDEQRAIIAALPHHKSIKVYALAGTGKTTTLKAIAQAYPKAKMLYLAFNKAIADEAKSKFPPNVEVRTVHSLAFSRGLSFGPGSYRCFCQRSGIRQAGG